MKILLWIRCEQLEFAQLLNDKKIDIALLSEAKLPRNAHFHIPGYNSYWKPGPSPKFGGTTVIIKNTIQHTQTFINGLTIIQNTAIAIYTRNQPITVGAIYISIVHRLTKKHTCRNHPPHGRGDLAFEAEHKAETFAETVDSNFKSRTDDCTHECFHRRTRKEVRDFLAGASFTTYPPN